MRACLFRKWLKWSQVCFRLLELVIDSSDERILVELRDGQPRTFTSLLAQVQFNHNTHQHHLERLTIKGLVVRQKVRANGFGRPKFMYVPLGTRKQVTSALEDPIVELGAIAFKRLRHICRFEKGGYCKETRKDCSPQICPQIRK